MIGAPSIALIMAALGLGGWQANETTAYMEVEGGYVAVDFPPEAFCTQGVFLWFTEDPADWFVVEVDGNPFESARTQVYDDASGFVLSPAALAAIKSGDEMTVRSIDYSVEVNMRNVSGAIRGAINGCRRAAKSAETREKVLGLFRSE